MKRDPKRAAAVSAVAAYIKAGEEEALATEAETAEVSRPAAPASAGAAPAALWSLSGRQQQMQMRSLVQMKALHRTGSLRR